MSSHSFCDKVKQFFRDINIKKSCVSSCCNTEIIIEEIIDDCHNHHHHHNKKDILEKIEKNKKL